jgi:hypothetical protein
MYCRDCLVSYIESQAQALGLKCPQCAAVFLAKSIGLSDGDRVQAGHDMDQHAGFASDKSDQHGDVDIGDALAATREDVTQFGPLSDTVDEGLANNVRPGHATVANRTRVGNSSDGGEDARGGLVGEAVMPTSSSDSKRSREPSYEEGEYRQTPFTSSAHKVPPINLNRARADEPIPPAQPPPPSAFMEYLKQKANSKELKKMKYRDKKKAFEGFCGIGIQRRLNKCVKFV